MGLAGLRPRSCWARALPRGAQRSCHGHRPEALEMVLSASGAGAGGAAKGEPSNLHTAASGEGASATAVPFSSRFSACVR